MRKVTEKEVEDHRKEVLEDAEFQRQVRFAGKYLKHYDAEKIKIGSIAVPGPRAEGITPRFLSSKKFRCPKCGQEEYGNVNEDLVVMCSGCTLARAESEKVQEALETLQEAKREISPPTMHVEKKLPQNSILGTLKPSLSPLKHTAQTG